MGWFHRSFFYCLIRYLFGILSQCSKWLTCPKTTSIQKQQKADSARPSKVSSSRNSRLWNSRLWRTPSGWKENKGIIFATNQLSWNKQINIIKHVYHVWNTEKLEWLMIHLQTSQCLPEPGEDRLLTGWEVSWTTGGFKFVSHYVVNTVLSYKL